MHKNQNQYQPLADESRSHISTSEAAFHLNLKPQTLRVWACYQNGPIVPVKLQNRLVWSVAKIRSLLGGE